MTVKMFGLRSLKRYFSEKQNVFDFVVVVTSSPSILAPMITGSIGQRSGLGSLSAFRVFRLFRVFRVARLLHKVQSLRKLLTAVTGSMTSLLNLLFFMLFTLVTLAIVTKDLFARGLPPSQDARYELDNNGFSRYVTGPLPRYNYDDFFNSFLSLFIIMTGENWTEFYYYTGLTTTAAVSTVVQIFYFILSNYVLISMFVAIIIQNFEADDAEREQQQRNAYSQIRTAIARA
jgi:voltage-dependent calcium channel